MAKTSSQRLHDAQQAMASIQRYVASEPRERLNDDLSRLAVERQLSIVQEALQVALLQEPALRQSWPDMDAALRTPVRLGASSFRGGARWICGQRNTELAGQDCRAAQAAAGTSDKVGSADWRESEEVGI